eukprot:CAMPEP_0183738498 /NCGR_PEP_ID=MMETSP0737-20130205/54703_1 /TAXON_ID=385413 /ORGANISM="Thalassiosira miniscula, Strain CCMP1093" /LENGTH=83 /DNA_ID=CAMNT_0025973043 /DNA_START=473 /DNA_END=721 /DNA_ORIENTATION=-
MQRSQEDNISENKQGIKWNEDFAPEGDRELIRGEVYDAKDVHKVKGARGRRVRLEDEVQSFGTKGSLLDGWHSLTHDEEVDAF